MNTNWTKWILASCTKFYQDICDDANIKVKFIDDGIVNNSEYVEVRFLGPSINEISNGIYRIDLEINILVTVAIGNNQYRPHEIAGILQNACQKDIGVYKYGKTSTDDKTLAFTLRLRRDLSDNIKWIYFGKPDANVALNQGVITVRYRNTVEE